MAAAKTKSEPKAPAPPTPYVVLERVDVEPLPRTLWAPVLNQTAAEGADGEVRVFIARGKAAAIRMHTGEGEDVKPGAWKAIPVSSWKGGEQTGTKVVDDRRPLVEAL